jgi:hypothetical protein
MVFCNPYKQLPGYCKVYHSMHSCILPTTSILQLNAHSVFATYIFFYQISPTCFGVLYTILREKSVCLLKTVSFLLKDDSFKQIYNVHMVGVLK